MSWYYSQAGTQQGPVEASQIRDLLDSGQLSGADLAWKTGMTNWQRLDQLAEFGASAQAESSTALQSTQTKSTPEQSSTTQEGDIYLAPQAQNPLAATAHAEILQLFTPLLRERKWLKFIGIFTLVYGILSALMLVGIPFIFAGLWLMRASSLLQQMELSAHPSQAHEINQEFAKSIKLYGICLLVYLILMAIFIVAYLVIILIVFAGAFATASASAVAQ